MKAHRGLVVVAAAIALTACGGQNSSAPSATNEPSASNSPIDTTTQSPSTTDHELISELVGFTSPSGNVGCFIASTTARCDVSERDWSPPPRPADCEFDYGQGISLEPGGRAGFVCAGDTALGGGQPLAYGKSLSAGALVCESSESGITCRDTATGHGFSIAREAYRLF
jgi:hypothetical protein